MPLFESLSVRVDEEWTLINKREALTLQEVQRIEPLKIFIPHWSYLIPEEIFASFECIVFHMTDLPYGRGGSPLQNLIVRGHSETRISAIKVDKGLDTGAVYLKSPLLLTGTAEEIFLRSVDVISQMIRTIIELNPIPIPQSGEPVLFKRKEKKDGNLEELASLLEVYDYIRMLDCEGYPNAFVETKNFRFEFSRASIKSNQTLLADVRISKK